MNKKMAMLLALLISVTSCRSIALAANEGSVAPSGLTHSELRREVDELAARYIGGTVAGAAVIVIRDGEAVLNRAYGMADRENGVAVDDDTVFEWGSATKLLVWTSVMQLVEQGRLNLNEDVRNYLPAGFLTKLQFPQPITMQNLMHHNAGWEDHLTDLFYQSADHLRSLEESLRICEPVQVAEPGAVVSYSNYGVALAGYLVERLTGQPFYQYVNDHIFSVLGMQDTAIHPSQADNLGVAARREQIHGYRTKGEGTLIRSQSERIFIGLYPAGSAIGTALDAAKFISALLPKTGTSSPLFKSNTILNEMLSTSYRYTDNYPGIAHGFWEDFAAVRILGHGGNTDSFSSYLAIAPAEGAGLVVMTNQAADQSLCPSLPTVVFGSYVAPPADDLPAAQQVAGRYTVSRRPYYGFTKVMGLLQTVTINAIDNQTITALGSTYQQVQPYIYQQADGNGLLHFSLADGRVSRVSMMCMDLLPLSTGSFTGSVVSIGLLAVCLLFLATALVIMLINRLRHRGRELHKSLIWTGLLNLTGAIAVLNTANLFSRAMGYAPYAALRVNFLLNYAYLGFTAICLAVIGWRASREALTKRQKLFIVLSCVAALVLAATIIGWQLYK